MSKFIMNNYLIFLGFFFIALSLNTYAVVPNVPYKTVALPANFGAWGTCSLEATTNAAYSVRLAPPSSELSSPPFGTSIKGKNKAKLAGYGFIVALFNPVTEKVYLDRECGNYACYAVDTFATVPSGRMCAIVINPTSNDATLNVVVTFTAESPFITNDLSQTSNFTYALTGASTNETLSYNFDDYITTSQLSKRYYRG
jgi:hypothetical protein